MSLPAKSILAESSRKRQKVTSDANIAPRQKERTVLLGSSIFYSYRVMYFDILWATKWDTEVQGYLEATRWEFLNTPHSKIYPISTTEFLSTVGVKESTSNYDATSYGVDS